MFRSSPPEVFPNKGTVQIRSEPTKLLFNFIETTPIHQCAPENPHHIRKTPFPRRKTLGDCSCT